MKSSKQTVKITISDHTAELINRMANKFYADEENIKRFNEWHLKIYGCLPDEASKAARKGRLL